jgi:transposase-like protein
VLSGNRNRRNGVNKKTIKGTSDGSFEPQIVKKHQTTISDEIEEKILSMYGLCMNYKDISSHIENIY